MKNYLFLVALVIATVEVGCTHYSYPPHTETASSLNADLISSHDAPKALGSAIFDIKTMTCQGADYLLTVHYDTTFEDIQYADLQYQVIPNNPGAQILFTQPNGSMSLDPKQASGDVVLKVAANQVTEKDSDILVRIKLRSKIVMDFVSAQEQIHVTDLCR